MIQQSRPPREIASVGISDMGHSIKCYRKALTIAFQEHCLQRQQDV